ncbi:MAG: hypothetical protein J4F30_06170, partial [Acidobacteria bacterium]|nr:hypothetical protein [Acidobacteriota bacterium]
MRKAQAAPATSAAAPGPTAQFSSLPPARAMLLPQAVSFLILAFSLAGSVARQPRLFAAIVGAGGALLAWAAVLQMLAVRRRRTFAL